MQIGDNRGCCCVGVKHEPLSTMLKKYEVKNNFDNNSKKADKLLLMKPSIENNNGDDNDIDNENNQFLILKI